MATAQEGSIVKVHYTGTLDDGSTFDSSVGKEPLSFTLGQGQVIKGFEDAVIGMSVGEEKDITLSSEQAYGARREELVQKVPKEALGELEAKVGMLLALQVPGTEQTIPGLVTEVGEDDFTIDINPPLAGKTLHFHLTLDSIA